MRQRFLIVRPANPDASPVRGWRRRYTLVLLCFLATFICYIDRTNISVAIIPMAKQFGWDSERQGTVLATIPGIVGVYASGLILAWTNSWVLVFSTAAGVALFGMAFYLIFGSCKRVFD